MSLKKAASFNGLGKKAEGYYHINEKELEKYFWLWRMDTKEKACLWSIEHFFHEGNQAVVEWYFINEMDLGDIEEFDGISLIEWTNDNKIKSLKEFSCNLKPEHLLSQKTVMGRDGCIILEPSPKKVLSISCWKISPRGLQWKAW